MLLHVSSTFAHHHEVKISLHSLWYHHTYRCDDIGGRLVHRCMPMHAQPVLSQPVHQKATYRCDDARDCVMQF